MAPPLTESNNSEEFYVIEEEDDTSIQAEGGRLQAPTQAQPQPQLPPLPTFLPSAVRDPTAAPAGQTQYSPIDSVALNTANAILLGQAPRLKAADEALGTVLGPRSMLDTRGVGDIYSEALPRIQAEYNQTNEQNPISGFLGSLIGGLPTASRSIASNIIESTGNVDFSKPGEAAAGILTGGALGALANKFPIATGAGLMGYAGMGEGLTDSERLQTALGGLATAGPGLASRAAGKFADFIGTRRGEAEGEVAKGIQAEDVQVDKEYEQVRKDYQNDYSRFEGDMSDYVREQNAQRKGYESDLDEWEKGKLDVDKQNQKAQKEYEKLTAKEQARFDKEQAGFDKRKGKADADIAQFQEDYQAGRDKFVTDAEKAQRKFAALDEENVGKTIKRADAIGGKIDRKQDAEYRALLKIIDGGLKSKDTNTAEKRALSKLGNEVLAAMRAMRNVNDMRLEMDDDAQKGLENISPTIQEAANDILGKFAKGKGERFEEILKQTELEEALKGKSPFNETPEEERSRRNLFSELLRAQKEPVLYRVGSQEYSIANPYQAAQKYRDLMDLSAVEASNPLPPEVRTAIEANLATQAPVQQPPSPVSGDSTNPGVLPQTLEVPQNLNPDSTAPRVTPIPGTSQATYTPQEVETIRTIMNEVDARTDLSQLEKAILKAEYRRMINTKGSGSGGSGNKTFGGGPSSPTPEVQAPEPDIDTSWTPRVIDQPGLTPEQQALFSPNLMVGGGSQYMPGSNAPRLPKYLNMEAPAPFTEQPPVPPNLPPAPTPLTYDRAPPQIPDPTRPPPLPPIAPQQLFPPTPPPMDTRVQERVDSSGPNIKRALVDSIFSPGAGAAMSGGATIGGLIGGKPGLAAGIATGIGVRAMQNLSSQDPAARAYILKAFENAFRSVPNLAAKYGDAYKSAVARGVDGNVQLMYYIQNDPELAAEVEKQM